MLNLTMSNLTMILKTTIQKFGIRTIFKTFILSIKLIKRDSEDILSFINM